MAFMVEMSGSGPGAERIVKKSADARVEQSYASCWAERQPLGRCRKKGVVLEHHNKIPAGRASVYPARLRYGHRNNGLHISFLLYRVRSDGFPTPGGLWANELHALLLG
jgi:hypothetical protein